MELMNFNKGGRGYEMAGDLYQLFVKYYNFVPGSDFWDAITKDTDAFAQKYSTDEDVFPMRLQSLLIWHADCQQRKTLPYCAACDGSMNLIDALVDWRHERQKIGKWKYTADGYPVCTACGCEVCGHGGVKGNTSKFCPNCGVKMLMEADP